MVSYGCIEICKLLLSCGALPNISGYEKKTPLHDAAESDRIEEAKLLLDYHADKNLYDQYGKKPMYVYAHYNIIRYLETVFISLTNLNLTLQRLL